MPQTDAQAIYSRRKRTLRMLMTATVALWLIVAMTAVLSINYVHQHGHVNVVVAVEELILFAMATTFTWATRKGYRVLAADYPQGRPISDGD